MWSVLSRDYLRYTLIFDKCFQGNFSPGSFFLKGAISECPKINLFLILYFLIKYLVNFSIECICFFENFL